MHKFRTARKLRKIRDRTQASYSVPRGYLQLLARPTVPDRGQVVQNRATDSNGTVTVHHTINSSRDATGLADSNGKDGTTRSPLSASLSAPGETGGSQRSPQKRNSTLKLGGQIRSEVVEQQVTHHSRQLVHSTATHTPDTIRRVVQWLGSEFQKPTHTGHLELATSEPTYQRSGNAGGVENATALSERVDQQNCHVPHRQSIHSSISEEARGHTFTSTNENDKNSAGVCNQSQHDTAATPYPGTFKCLSGHGVASGSGATRGVDTVETVLPLDYRKITLGSTIGGSIRDTVQQPVEKVHIAMPRRAGAELGRVEQPMAANNIVRVPTNNNIGQTGRAPSERDSVQNSARSADVPGRKMVPVGCAAVTAATNIDTNAPRGNQAAALETLPPRPPGNEPIPVDNKSWWLNKRGFSHGAITRIEEAHAKSTQTVYGAQWKVFERWCLLKSLSPVSATAPVIADFLIHLFDDRKLATRSIEGYRSALTATLKNSSGYDPGQDETLSKLIRHFKL